VRPPVRVIRHGRFMTFTTGSTQHSASTSSTVNRPALRSTPLLHQLDREWARLNGRSGTLNRVGTWSGDDHFNSVISLATHLDDVIAATQPDAGPTGSGDEVLARLIELAAHDELAGRVVLQRILPGLISRSRRWHRRLDTGDPTDVIVGAAWMAIRGFDTSARRRFVAPALIADSLWIGVRRETRRKNETEVPTTTEVLGTIAAEERIVDPLTALAGTMRAAARAGVPDADLELIRSLVRAGTPTRAARDCNVTVRTIRNRRDVATAQVRSALGPDWADWSDPLVGAS
jgi:hypothetical protein